jgi:hypothetical protein
MSQQLGESLGSNLHILSWQDTLQLNWEALLAVVRDYCARRADIGVLIVDTLGAFCGRCNSSFFALWCAPAPLAEVRHH